MHRRSSHAPGQSVLKADDALPPSKDPDMCEKRLMDASGIAAPSPHSYLYRKVGIAMISKMGRRTYVVAATALAVVDDDFVVVLVVVAAAAAVVVLVAAALCGALASAWARPSLERLLEPFPRSARMKSYFSFAAFLALLYVYT